MKKILFALLVLSSFSAGAQFRFGPEISGSYNKMSDDKNVWGATAITSSRFGGRIGVIGDYGITEHLYVQPGVFFSMKSNKETANTSLTLNIPVSGFNLGANGSVTMEQKSKFSYIEVPVSIMYKWGEAGSGRFFLGLTPYVAYGIAGKQTVEQNIQGGIVIATFDSSIRNTTSNTFAEDSFGYKSMDYGFKICEGYEFSNGFYFRAEYSYGLPNLSNYPGAKSRHTGFALSIGYLFGDNKRKGQVAQ